jgi:hypothetical protein
MYMYALTPGFQVSRCPGFQVSRVPGFQVARHFFLKRSARLIDGKLVGDGSAKHIDGKLVDEGKPDSTRIRATRVKRASRVIVFLKRSVMWSSATNHSKF